MIHRLEQHQYEKVRPLFQGQHLALVIDAVIASNSPGTIWADHVTHPRTALLWDKAHCYYLVGATANPAFNKSLSELVTARLLPEALARRLGIFKVYYTSEGWERRVGVIFQNASLTKAERLFYAFRQSAKSNIGDWKDKLPVGFSLRPIDKTLLTITHLKNVRALKDEIESCWNSLDGFLESGFGFCLLNDAEIVCWCTAEYVSGRQCGIGIETVEAYMQRGFATLTASAFVDYCNSNHISPYWDSWKANLPSVAVAEKVGFQKLFDYAVYLGKMNVAANEADHENI